MGKIRIKALGIEELEKKQKKETKLRNEAKKIAKVPQDQDAVVYDAQSKTDQPLENKRTIEIKKTEKIAHKHKNNKVSRHSKKYQSLFQTVDRKKLYSLKEGLILLEKLQRKSFDETVEVHIDTLQAGISGNIKMPHGTGKKIKVAILDPNNKPEKTEALLKEITQGVISFDILIATPEAMPKLAKIAKILGPKGLMPNPKNGTITKNPEGLAKEYANGQISFKTESKLPIIHLTVGKISFGKDKLEENILSLIEAVKRQNIQKLTLKSTMSPGIKISLN